MNNAFSCSPWYAQEDLLKAVNACIDALNESGIKASRAELVPECLSKAIQCSNRMALDSLQFYGFNISVEKENGGFEVSPPEMRSSGNGHSSVVNPLSTISEAVRTTIRGTAATKQTERP